MNKQTVMIGVLATSAFVMSGYTLISNTMNDVSRQTFVYALKHESKRLAARRDKKQSRLAYVAFT